MQVMNQDLYNYLIQEKITAKEALKASPDPQALIRQMRTGGIDASASARDWMNEA